MSPNPNLCFNKSLNRIYTGTVRSSVHLTTEVQLSVMNNNITVGHTGHSPIYTGPVSISVHHTSTIFLSAINNITAICHTVPSPIYAGPIDIPAQIGPYLLQFNQQGPVCKTSNPKTNNIAFTRTSKSNYANLKIFIITVLLVKILQK